MLSVMSSTDEDDLIGIWENRLMMEGNPYKGIYFGDVIEQDRAILLQKQVTQDGVSPRPFFIVVNEDHIRLNGPSFPLMLTGRIGMVYMDEVTNQYLRFEFIGEVKESQDWLAKVKYFDDGKEGTLSPVFDTVVLLPDNFFQFVRLVPTELASPFIPENGIVADVVTLNDRKNLAALRLRQKQQHPLLKLEAASAYVDFHRRVSSGDFSVNIMIR